MSALTITSRRISRHVSVYASGTAATFLAGFALIPIITTQLTPAAYGQYAILSFFASFLLVIYNLGSLPGTYRSIFGASSDEAVGAAGAAGAPASNKNSTRKQALGSGLVFTVAFASAATVVIWLFAGPIAQGLVGDSHLATAVKWAALAGALAAPYRLTMNVYRYGRRPVAFAAVNVLRPLVLVVTVVIALRAGKGITGAVAGFTAANAIAMVITVYATRNEWTLYFSFKLAKEMFKRGAGMAVVGLSIWIIENADIYILSLYASHRDTGLYRVGSGISRLAAYGVQIFIMAEGPVTQSPLMSSVYRERGQTAFGALIIRYYMMATAVLVLALSLYAKQLIGVAGGAYSGAAGLVPLLAAGYVARGYFTIIYRGSVFPGKNRWYAGFSAAGAVVFLVGSVTLIPVIGSYGAATAGILGFAVSALAMLVKSQRGKSPLPLAYRQIGAALVVAGACGAAGRLGAGLVPSLALLIETLALLAYPALLLALHIIPPTHRTALFKMLTGIIPHQSDAERTETRLLSLSGEDLAVLEVAVRKRSRRSRRQPPAVHDDQVLLRVAQVLARLAGVESERPLTAEIGDYVVRRRAAGDRSAFERHLIHDEQFDGVVLDAITEAAAAVRHVPRRRWPTTAADWAAPDGVISPTVGDPVSLV